MICKLRKQKGMWLSFMVMSTLISLSFSTLEYLVIWKVWVTTSEWDFIHSERDFILDSLHGTLIFSHHRSEVPGFENFIQTVNTSKYPEDIYLTVLWFPFIPCTISESYCKTLENCPPNASLGWLPWQIFDTSMTEWSYSMKNAVYAVAWTLHKLFLQHAEMQPIKVGKVWCFVPGR